MFFITFFSVSSIFWNVGYYNWAGHLGQDVSGKV